MSRPLQDFRANTTSQFGEDGILAELFSRIGPGDRKCVECGAWDGRHFSNTWVLWHEQGWDAVLVEGERARCEALRDSLPKRNGLHAVNVFITPTGPASFDEILPKLGFARPDLLSLDIDGDEFHILEHMKAVQPRVMAVEFNPTCPPHQELIQVPGGRFGSSARSLLLAARSRGFRLAACTDTNLILVEAQEFPKLAMEEPTLESVFPYHHLTYLMTDYDGHAYVDHPPVYATNFGKKRGLLERRKACTTEFQKGSATRVRVESSD